MSDGVHTPLFDWHCQQGGKMVDFAGYRLALTYRDGGMIAEHVHTRTHASLFDVSHMGQVRIPPNCIDSFAPCVPADVAAIPSRRSCYTVLTLDTGGILDDCIIANDGDNQGLFMVINAARKTVDIDHLQKKLGSSSFTVIDNRALLALQGPLAAAVMSDLCPSLAKLDFMSAVWVDIDGINCRVARCGYTGEDGFELSVPASAAVSIANKLIFDERVKPAGLAARDSLRLEAGLCLYGHELDEDISPIEADLLWTIPKHRRQSQGYIGAKAINQHRLVGVSRRRVGLVVDGKVPVRFKTPLFVGNRQVGVVTSGGYSPTLGKPIAMAYISKEVSSQTLTANVRHQSIRCHITNLPFVAHRYYQR